jgi:hypothetical protein
MDMEMPPTGAVPGFISASSLCDIATCIEFVYDFISASSVWDHRHITVCSSLAAARRRSSDVAAGMSGVSAASPGAAQIGDFLAKKPYAPPSWASHLSLAPSHIFSLGQVSFHWTHTCSND